VPIDCSDFVKLRLDKGIEIIKSIDVDSVCDIAQTLHNLKKAQGTLFLAGNGGSSALVSHFTADAGVGNLKFNSHLKCISLMENASVLTATSNDFGYENAISRQIEVHGSEGDVLMVVSSSGNSQNLINGVAQAKSKRMGTCALIGFDGGKLLNMVDKHVIVKSKIGEYEMVEDAHSIILHIIAQLLRITN
jgi:D-sedoheptulose 7-phosphate isomerase